MQITIKLKGFLKIAAFFAIVVLSLSYISYKAYKYIRYRKIWHDIHVKQKNKLVFTYKFEIADSMQKGYLLLSPYALSGKCNELIIMDLAGHIVMREPMKCMATDFRQWNINGHIRYSYFAEDSNEFSAKGKTAANGHYVILDSALTEIKEVHLLPHDDITPGEKQDLDGHDLIMLADDHYIVFANYLKRVNNIPVFLSPAPMCKVTAPVIQEIIDDKVVWQWDATHYPEFYLTTEGNNKFYDTTTPQDYMHLNSMILDPRDSDLIFSSPTMSQIIKINKHTGNIIWRLGGKNSDFPLTSQQIFLVGHNITLIDSNKTLLLLDNGDATKRPVSRVLEFKLDEKNKTITSFKSYNIPEPYSLAQGSVQKIGDDYLICGGYSHYLLMVNSITNTKKMEMVYNQVSYRVYFVKDITGINLNRN